MKTVWPTVWPGAEMAWMPVMNSCPSLKNSMRSRIGSNCLRVPSMKPLIMSFGALLRSVQKLKSSSDM